MNKLVLSLLVVSVIGCSPSKHLTQIEPDIPINSFTENGKTFSYLDKDNVIVSIGFDSYLNNEFVFDLTIDNQSDSTVYFDPNQAYLFSYGSDTISSPDALYFANNPDSVLLDMNKEIDSMDKQVRNSSIISAILGLAYITADIALAGGDLPDINRDLLGASHLAAQIIMDESRMNKINEIDNLSYVRCRTEEDIYRTTSIGAGEYHSGKLHFPITKAPYYNVYIPINSRIYNFRFKTKTES